MACVAVELFRGGFVKFSKLFIQFLILTIVTLTGICFYQQRIIAQQSFEIRWLMANSRR